MAFSEFLDGRRDAAKELVKELGNSFSYVSVLGTDVRASLYTADFKSSNARELLGQKDIDGALVGGASLKADDFAAIIKAAVA